MRVEPDNWLKSIFGHGVFRIVDFRQDDHDPQRELTSAIRSQHEAFFFSKVPVGNPDMLRMFLKSGFQIVDINVTLDRKPGSCIKPEKTCCTIRDAYPEECEAVERIAGVCFTKSRFHQDPKIPKEIANMIKRKWVKNYFNGERGERILVADMRGKPAGFLAIVKMSNGNQTLRIIDLIGVHPEFQGKGIGTELVSFFIVNSVNKCDILRVGTQLINLPSLHLYEKTGFCISDAVYVLHAHVRDGRVIP